MLVNYKMANVPWPTFGFQWHPLAGSYMQFMGSHIGKSSYLIKIRDSVSLRYGVMLEAFPIRDGWLYQGHIKIVSHTFIGNNSIIMLSASIGENSCVLEQSLVSENQSAPNAETWSGSLSKHVKSNKVLLDMKSHPTQ